MNKSDCSRRPLAGRAAVVTGGGQGLGRSHCLRLAEEGAKVVVNDLGADIAGFGSDPARAERVVDEIRAMGGEAVANTDSVASQAGGRRIIEAALDTFGKIDILINNAGNILPNRVFDITEEEIDLMCAVHIKGTASTCIAASGYFRKQRSGAIVNTGSESGLGNYGNSMYAAAKEAVAGFTRSIARDLGPYGGRANLIRPAAVTVMSTSPKISELILECEEGFGLKSVEHFFASRMDVTNLTPQHVSDFAIWLCTDAAAHVNGRDFRVMGGEITMLAIPFPLRTIFQDKRWDIETLSGKGAAANLHGHLKNEYIPIRWPANEVDAG